MCPDTGRAEGSSGYFSDMAQPAEVATRRFAAPLGRLLRPKTALWVAVGAAIYALFVWVLPLLPSNSLSGRWETPLPIVTLGLIVGLTYGLLAVGLVVIYRANRIINFAHGEIGAFGSAFLGLAVVEWNLPYWLGFVAALMLTGLVAAGAEVAVIRRLRNAPRLMSVVATLGVGQLLVTFALVINAQAGAGNVYPEPAGFPSFDVGALLVTPAYAGMLFLAPVVVIALGIFLKRSRYGLAIRGAADNPDSTRLSGASASAMSSLAWALAGALSAFTAILTQPTQGFSAAATFGPSLLLRAMAGAVIARMTSLPLALLGGAALGVIEQLLLFNYAQSGLVNAVLFGIVLVALLAQKAVPGREEEKGSWAAVQALRPIPDVFLRFWTVRNLGRLTALTCFALIAVLPFVIPNTAATTIIGMFAFAIVGLSIGIVTGLGGQLTLGQFALAAVGGVTAVFIVNRTGDFPLAFVYGGLAAAAVSLLIGLPALRIKGLLLTVTTLGFALITPTYLLTQPWTLEIPVQTYKPTVFGNPLDTGDTYYYFGLGMLLLTLWIARNIRRSGLGRQLIGIRDNEDNARAFTVRATGLKLQAFLLSGFIAGLGGALYAHSLASIEANAFGVDASINTVMMTVVGGISILAGPLLGVLLVVGVPSFLPLDNAGLAASALGVLLIILYLPGGLASLVQPLRDRILRRLGRRAGIDVDAAFGGETAASVGELAGSIEVREPVTEAEPGESRAPLGNVLLRADGLRKTFGGLAAVDDVSLLVRSGETVGMIGPNGAGKTTTFELLGGFTAADAGDVRFNGIDVTWMAPEARARLGLVRSFQDATLFPTMTVQSTVELALERVMPTRFFSSVVGLRGLDRRREKKAREIISFMGLDRYRSKQVRELSTGTRRITEIACLVAMRPTLLLLDEPSSGIAQRETERLGELLEQLKTSLDVTLFVIEHDIPLIMGVSDRIIAMDAGKVIAEGTPDVVRNDPEVIAAYLGGSTEAIERSGAMSAG